MNPLLFTPRRRIAAALWLSLGITGAALAQPQPPLAERAPKALTAHGETRIDDYYWLRDDSRTEPKVLDYLKAENRYTEQMMAPYQKLRATLYQEMLGRMNPDDRSVPYQLNGYRYQESYAAGKDFALYQRQALIADAPWQTLLDANQRAAGHAYYRLGRWMSARTTAGWRWPKICRAAANTASPARYRQRTLVAGNAGKHLRQHGVGQRQPNPVLRAQPPTNAVAIPGLSPSVRYADGGR